MIEILLVVGIGAIIFGFSAPYTLNFYRTQLLEDVRSNLIDTLQRARHNAVLQKNDSSFGVHMVNGSYTLFQGADYENMVSGQEEVFAVNEEIVFSGLIDVTFSKMTGNPSVTGTTTLTYGTTISEILIEESGNISKIN
jgi:Tfp pilus assembly protein FimT